MTKPLTTAWGEPVSDQVALHIVQLQNRIENAEYQRDSLQDTCARMITRIEHFNRLPWWRRIGMKV